MNEEFFKKLPQVIGWIDDMLTEHASNTLSVADFRFDRLPKFFRADLLAHTNVVVVPKIPVPPLSDLGLPQFEAFEKREFKALTYKNTYFLQTRHAKEEAIHFRQLIQVVQWAHLGVHGYLLGYAGGLLHAPKFEDHPLESMAYGLEEYFISQKPPFNVENYICNEVSQQLMVPENETLWGNGSKRLQ